MLWFGLVGLVANTLAVALLHGRRESSLNMRGAYLEVLGDLAGSAAVVVAAIAGAVAEAVAAPWRVWWVSDRGGRGGGSGDRGGFVSQNRRGFGDLQGKEQKFE